MYYSAYEFTSSAKSPHPPSAPSPQEEGRLTTRFS